MGEEGKIDTFSVFESILKSVSLIVLLCGLCSDPQLPHRGSCTGAHKDKPEKWHILGQRKSVLCLGSGLLDV